MAIFTSVRHHGCRTQAAWTKKQAKYFQSYAWMHDDDDDEKYYFVLIPLVTWASQLLRYNSMKLLETTNHYNG